MSTLKVNTIQDTSGNVQPFGITMQDSWVVTSGYSTNATVDITANWARHSAASSTFFGNIGSAMTESSGVFTFPSTGIYLVMASLVVKTNGGGRTYLGAEQRISSDSGSNYTDASVSYNSGYQNNAYASAITIAVYNVTNASNFRWKLRSVFSDTTLVVGDATNKLSGVTFTRLGDT
ncbi:hypothetical protein [Hyphomonas sp.]|uniref:hypothetical protein n=1 Tax=Hyphomonas sp. TaxID=87 RepID=UPI0025BA637C|nr:hypothetical protein [Hyphomonas sp.]|tara:strand:+ start:183 stop:713 length:531 start_codon:yes stop_codon:yes gene_type:complete